MGESAKTIDVYLEIGQKRTFASAIHWPGWCRIGRDEASALQSLCDYGPRYARVLQTTPIAFQLPTAVSAFRVVERLVGNATTDFGAPDIAPSSDMRRFDAAELEHVRTLLQAYWRAFDAAVEAASGKELRKGPRGGGREIEGIIQHVLGADRSYLTRLAWKYEKREAQDLREELSQTRQAILDALTAAAHGAIPAHGPRGGKLWPPHYFVRRIAWHVLDHVWEIEDRAS